MKNRSDDLIATNFLRILNINLDQFLKKLFFYSRRFVRGRSVEVVQGSPFPTRLVCFHGANEEIRGMAGTCRRR